MNSAIDMTQKARQVGVATALGDDGQLTFRRMVYHEQLSRLFEMELDLLSPDEQIDPYAMLGTNLTVRLECRQRNEARHFNGFVSSFAYAGHQGRMVLYRAKVVPWTWFLTQRTDSRIFQEKTAREIIEQIFNEAGFSDYEIKASLDVRYDYCVQYLETTFDFISRILEREGAYYHFEHENGSHKLVITDDMEQHEAEDGYEQFKFAPPDEAMRIRSEYVLEWDDVAQVRPTRVDMQDFDFTQSRANLGADSSIARSHELSQAGHYLYPGGYTTKSEGDRYAKLRAEALQARHQEMTAKSNIRGVAAGRMFELVDHPISARNQRGLVIESRYVIEMSGYESGEDAAELAVRNEFVAIPADAAFRPPLITPRPQIVGPQTAIVTGASGKEIDLDEHGRINVLFHWEREGASSCRVRVAQMFAGAQWGALAHPRVGQEVIVDFLNGDPDRPIVTGRVYNNVSQPPYPPESKPTITTLKTSSSPGGNGFNELQFEDKAGEEHVFLHSQKDTHLRTGNDKIELVANDDHETIGGNAFSQIGKDSSQTIDGDHHLTVGGASNLDVGEDLLVNAGGDMVAQAGQTVHIKAGMKVVIEGGTQLTLKVGGNFVNISPAGVDIVGTMVKINSGGAAGSAPGTKPKKAEKPIEPHEEKPGTKSSEARSRTRPKMDRAALSKHPAAAALIEAADTGAPFCEICAKMARRGTG